MVGVLNAIIKHNICGERGRGVGGRGRDIGAPPGGHLMDVRMCTARPGGYVLGPPHSVVVRDLIGGGEGAGTSPLLSELLCGGGRGRCHADWGEYRPHASVCGGMGHGNEIAMFHILFQHGKGTGVRQLAVHRGLGRHSGPPRGNEVISKLQGGVSGRGEGEGPLLMVMAMVLWLHREGRTGDSRGRHWEGHGVGRLR